MPKIRLGCRDEIMKKTRYSLCFHGAYSLLGWIYNHQITSIYTLPYTHAIYVYIYSIYVYMFVYICVCVKYTRKYVCKSDAKEIHRIMLGAKIKG